MMVVPRRIPEEEFQCRTMTATKLMMTPESTTTTNTNHNHDRSSVTPGFLSHHMDIIGYMNMIMWEGYLLLHTKQIIYYQI